jgi:hypothetical protein
MPFPTIKEMKKTHFLGEEPEGLLPLILNPPLNKVLS